MKFLGFYFESASKTETVEEKSEKESGTLE